MTIAHAGTGTRVAATTGATTPTLPGTAAAGDLLVAYATARYSTATLTVPSGFTLQTPANNPGGTGTDANGTGTTDCWISSKEAVGGETGTLSITVSGNNYQAHYARFTKAAGTTWSVQGAGGADTSLDTSYSAASSATLDLQPGDVVLVTTVINDDVPTFSAQALSAPGITFGSGTIDTPDAGSASGSDQRAGIYRATVTAGSGTVTVTFTQTLSVAAAGSTAFLRIREVAATTPVTAQLDLRWAVRAVVTDQLDLRWAVLGRTFRLRQGGPDGGSAVRGGDAQRATSIIADVERRLDLRWRMLARLTDQLDVRWATLARVTDDLDLRWAVDAIGTTPVTDQLDLRWAVLSRITDDADLRWAVLARLVDDLDVRWAVRTVVTDQLDVRWAVLARLTDDADLRWRVRTIAPILEGYGNGIVGGAGATSVTVPVPAGVPAGGHLVAVIAWRGQGAITPVEAGWAERADTALTGGPSLGLYERDTVGGDPTSYTWNFGAAAARVVGVIAWVSGTGNAEALLVATGTSATPTAPSVNSGGANRLLLALWAKTHLELFTGLPPAGMADAWYLSSGGATAGVIEQAASTEVVPAGATGTRAVGIAGPTSRNWLAASLLFAPATTTVTAQLDLRWQVIGGVADQLDLRWAVRAVVTDQLDLRWAIRTSLTDQLDLRWAVLARLADDVDLRWRVLARLADDVDLRWAVLAQLADQLDLRWAVLEVVTGDLDVQWVVLTLAPPRDIRPTGRLELPTAELALALPVARLELPTAELGEVTP